MKGGPFLRNKTTGPKASAYFEFFKSVEWEEADQYFRELVQRAGPDKPPLYYLEGVRRKIVERRHEVQKAAPPAASLKNLIESVAANLSATNAKREGSNHARQIYQN
jgi:hypothetical protein